MKRDTLWLLVGLGALLLLGAGGIAVLADWKRNGSAYLPTLNAVEDQFGIPRDLLARVAYQESHFRDDIITGATASPAGALGIMQMMPQYFPNVNLLDPVASIQAAGAYLKQLYNEFGTWELALAAYNAGPGNVQKYGGIPPFPETQSYVSDILADVPVST